MLVAEPYSNVNVFFIHSAVDGHLGCVHVLAIVNTAAVNIGMHVSFQTMLAILMFLQTVRTVIRSYCDAATF